jgi:hypothetical protein
MGILLKAYQAQGLPGTGFIAPLKTSIEWWDRQIQAAGSLLYRIGYVARKFFAFLLLALPAAIGILINVCFIPWADDTYSLVAMLTGVPYATEKFLGRFERDITSFYREPTLQSEWDGHAATGPFSEEELRGSTTLIMMLGPPSNPCTSEDRERRTQQINEVCSSLRSVIVPLSRRHAWSPQIWVVKGRATNAGVTIELMISLPDRIAASIGSTRLQIKEPREGAARVSN